MYDENPEFLVTFDSSAYFWSAKRKSSTYACITFKWLISKIRFTKTCWNKITSSTVTPRSKQYSLFNTIIEFENKPALKCFFPTTDCTGVIFGISDWVLVSLLPRYLSNRLHYYLCTVCTLYSVSCSRCTRDMDAWGSN